VCSYLFEAAGVLLTPRAEMVGAEGWGLADLKSPGKQ
jgi:hypothetical protein